jgi:hypothetical protein
LTWTPGDIDGVTAGNGLTGGGVSGTVILNVEVPLSLSGSSSGSIISGDNSNTASGYGVWGEGEIGVYGKARSGSGTYGVYGHSNSDVGYKYGYLGGEDYGVFGHDSDNGAYGYLGGSSYGVFGRSSNYAVRGEATSSYGVYGSAVGNYGVYGSANDYSVFGRGSSTVAYGVYGTLSNASATSTAAGIVGTDGPSASAYAGKFYGNVSVNGNMSVTGTKPFVQVHPTDPSKEIVYIALEGGENGVFVRGSGQLENGWAEIELPEHFALVTVEEGLTAQVTPKDGKAKSYLYVEEVMPDHIIVVEAGNGSSNASFDYLVMGVRRGFEDHQVIRENKLNKPDPKMSQEEYYERMARPKNRGRRELLIRNGTLTPEGKINQETAERLGWKLGPKTKKEWMEKMNIESPQASDAVN